MSMKDRVRRPSTCRPHPKIKFSKEEDERLRQVISHYGVQDWDAIADQMPGRNQRQCRERWFNYLSPSVNKEPFTPEEDQLLIEKYNEHGSRWVRIAKFFSGRSDTAIKNRWMALQRKIILEEEEKLAQVYEESGQLSEYGNAPYAESTKANGNRHSRNIKSSIPSRSLLSSKITKNKPHKKTANNNKLETGNSIIKNEPQLNQPQIFMSGINNSNSMFQPQNNSFIQYRQNSFIPPYQQTMNQFNLFQHYPNPTNANPTMTSSVIPNQTIPPKQPEQNHIPQNPFKKQKEPLAFPKDSNVVDENDEVDFWNEVFASNEFQSNADAFNWF